MQHAAECSSSIFSCTEHHATLRHIFSCCNTSRNTKNDAMQCHGTSFCCHSTKSFAMAQRALPRHKEIFCGMKRFAMAWRDLLQCQKHDCSTRRITAAQSTTPCHKKHHCSTKCNATAQRIWPWHQHQHQHQHRQVDCFSFRYVFGFFPGNCFGLLWKVPDVAVYWWPWHLFHQWLPMQKVFCKTFAGLLLFCIMIIF